MDGRFSHIVLALEFLYGLLDIIRVTLFLSIQSAFFSFDALLDLFLQNLHFLF